MYNIRTNLILLELCVMRKKTKKKEEDEQNRNFPRLVFSTMIKVNATNRVGLALD